MKHRVLYKVIVAAGLGLAVILLGSLPALVAAQEPVDSSFTFQGRLRRTGGAYVTDPACDFRFSLWDSSADPTGQIGAALTRLDVPVQDGYFKAALDFGSVFDGAERYLQIGVRCPANGGAGPYSLLGGRARLNAIPYALHAQDYGGGSLPWEQVTGKPPGFADDVDNVMTYTNGFGLALNDNQFSVIPESVINDTFLQRRVLGSCPPGQTIQAINADGSVACRDGDVDYSAGEGLTLAGPDLLNRYVLGVNLDVIQERIDSLLCGPDPGSLKGIRRVLATGAVECEPSPGGDITGLAPGAGLAVVNGNGPGALTVTVAAGGITTPLLAGNAVRQADLAGGAVDNTALADGAVIGAKIVNRSLKREDLSASGCITEGYKIMWTDGAWGCGPDTSAELTAGRGITLTGLTVSAVTGDGVKISDAGAIVPDYGGPGSASTLARTSHAHAGLYVEYGANPSGGDLDGNYNPGGGFTVTGLLGDPFQDTPAGGQTFVYRTSPTNHWEFTSYNFNPNVYVEYGTGDGASYATCGTGYKVIGGGCECGSEDPCWWPWSCDNIIDTEAAYPDEATNSWRCECNKDTIASKATAFCLQTVYK